MTLKIVNKILVLKIIPHESILQSRPINRYALRSFEKFSKNDC